MFCREPDHCPQRGLEASPVSVVFSSSREADAEGCYPVPVHSGACPLSASSKGAKSSSKLTHLLSSLISFASLSQYTDGEVLGSAKWKGSLQACRLGSRDLEDSALGINRYDCD